MTPQRILVIDDDLDVCDLISSTAEDMGIPCTTTHDADNFFRQLLPQTDVILIDLVMPETDGIEILRMLGDRHCKAGIIVMSGIGPRVMDTAVALGASLGLAIIGHLSKPFRINDLEEMLQRAPPVRTERSSGKHSAIKFDPAELWRAIENREFILHYQPQIETATGRCIGMEALVRWDHPTKGLIFPNDFIEYAEDLELIDKLTWLVIERGFIEMGHVVDANGRPLRLSLNISVFSLRDIYFPDTLLALAGQHDIELRHIMLEITESGLIRELSQTLDVLTRLRMKGVGLSIDDFGTGYSMMQQLRHIPANEIKIDKSLVQGMNGHNDRVMIEKIIEMGAELGMTVVAEGTENAEQIDFLASRKCDIIQGYFFSKPLPPEAFLTWLSSHEANS